MNIENKGKVIQWLGGLEESKENYQIEKEEVKEPIKELQRGKLTGIDQISAEMLKYMGTTGIEFVTRLCNRCLDEGNMPQEWKVGIINPCIQIIEALLR